MPHTDYLYIACDKYGNPKNMNPFKKRIRRVRFPKDMKTYKRLGMHKRNNEWLNKFLNSEPSDKVIATQQAMP